MNYILYMSCKTCKYWIPIQKELWGVTGIPLGECHFNPPHPAWNRKFQKEIIDQYISWALTADKDFCSEDTTKLEQESPKKGLFTRLFNKCV